MSNLNTQRPHPNYKNFDEFVEGYCEHFAHLTCVYAAHVRAYWCDEDALRKSYEAGEMAGDVAWDDYESSL